METEKLRTLVLGEAVRMRGKVWPNGLGFDKGRWSYLYREQKDIPPGLRWCASNSDHQKAGDGETPEAARKAAR